MVLTREASASGSSRTKSFVGTMDGVLSRTYTTHDASCCAVSALMPISHGTSSPVRRSVRAASEQNRLPVGRFRCERNLNLQNDEWSAAAPLRASAAVDVIW